MYLRLTDCSQHFSLLLPRHLLVSSSPRFSSFLFRANESRLPLRKDGRVGGGGAHEFVFLPVGTLAFLPAVSDGYALAKLVVADGGANLAPGWLPVEHLLEDGTLGGRRGIGVAVGKVDDEP